MSWLSHCSRRTTESTWRTTSMVLAPASFTTSRATPCWPLSHATVCGSAVSTAVSPSLATASGIDAERHHVQHARHLLDGRQEGAERRAHQLCRGAVLTHQHVGDHRRLVDVDRARARASRRPEARCRRAPSPRGAVPRAARRRPRIRRQRGPCPATMIDSRLLRSRSPCMRCSIGSVTPASASCGGRPGASAVTTTSGKVTSGKSARRR